MPLSIRPYQASDAPQLLARFSPETRAPWLRLPHPYTLPRLLEAGPEVQVFVAEMGSNQVVGLIAFDASQPEPLLVGPLVADEQLADLYARALITQGLEWGAQTGLERVRAKVDLGDERALAFFVNQGFHVLEGREYVLAARRSPKRPVPTPIEGVRFGTSPEMLSSDYIRLYREIGEPLGWHERLVWTRPQIFEHLQRKGVYLLSARAGETYLGFAELEERGPGDAELVLFGLMPAFRGRGVGSAFLEHVLHHAFEQLQLERVWCDVTVADEDAPRFCVERGMKQERALLLLERALVPAVAGDEALI